MQELENKVTELDGSSSTIDLRRLVKHLPHRIGYAKAVAESVNKKHGRRITERDVYNCVNRQLFDDDIFWAVCQFVEDHISVIKRQQGRMNELIQQIEPTNTSANGVADAQ